MEAFEGLAGVKLGKNPEFGAWVPFRTWWITVFVPPPPTLIFLIRTLLPPYILFRSSSRMYRQLRDPKHFDWSAFWNVSGNASVKAWDGFRVRGDLSLGGLYVGFGVACFGEQRVVVD